jgi:hypothetical protein
MTDPANGDDEDSSSSTNEGGRIVVTDLLGLGAAARSPAGKEIGNAFAKLFGSVTDPIRTLLVGLARTKVEAKRIVEIAKAEAQAREVQVASDQLIDRMKQRVITEEIRRQINIEVATTDAIEIVDSMSTDELPRQIEDDWMHKWTEGAQEASAVQVRQLWSRVLAAQSLASKESVSKPSLNLLQNLDSTLADALTNYVAFLMVYGIYPEHGKVTPGVVSPKQLAMLREIGFLQQTMPAVFRFSDFNLRFGSNLGLVMVHGIASLTHRGYELCTVIFDDDDPFSKSLKGKLPSIAEQTSMLLKLVEQAIEEHKRPISIFLRDESENEVVEIILKKGNTEPLCEFDKLVDRIKGYEVTPSDRLVGVLSRLTDLRLISAINKI